MSAGSNSSTERSHAQDPTRPSSGIEGQSTKPDEGNPWLPLCASRLSALDDPKIPLTEVKDKCEQELRWIEEAKRFIKSRLNMVCAIARLSPEVLAHVFRHLADIATPRRPYFGWMRVMHVCRSWRGVALECPDLWGQGNIYSVPSLLDERLRRSKEAPFDVVIQYRKIPPAVVANAHRIRKLTIISQSCIPRADVDASQRALLTSSAPSLVGFYYRHEVQNPGNRLKLPDNIFACNAPRLTLLCLENTTFTFHPSIFHNLVHLCLLYRNIVTSDNEDLPLNRNQLLELLLRTPKLETLILQGRIEDSLEDIESLSDADSSQPPALSSSVALARLKLLDLEGDPWSWLWLVGQLSIPAAASVQVCCRVVSPMQGQASVCDAFLPFMIHHLRKKDDSRSTRSLRISCNPGAWGFTVLAEWMNGLRDAVTPDWVAGIPPDFMEQTLWEPIAFSFYNGTAKTPVIPAVQILRPFLASICTNNIRHLKVCGTASHLDCMEWLKLFASFTALEHLSINGMVASNLMQALGLDLTLNLEPSPVLGNTSSPGEQVLFPNLRTLEFYRVDFTCFVSAADALLSDITTTALTERREMNRTLEEISVEGCCFRRRWVDGLRNVGLRVSGAPFESERNDDFGLMHPSREPSPSPFPLYD